MSEKACGKCYGCWRGTRCFTPDPGSPIAKVWRQLLAMDAHGTLRDPETDEPTRMDPERQDSELVAVQRRRMPRFLLRLIEWHEEKLWQVASLVGPGPGWEALQVDRISSDFDIASGTIGRIVRQTLREILARDAPEIMEAQYAQLGPLEPANCGSCRAPLLWIRTKAGRSSPCNPRRLSVTTAEGVTVVGYESHYATCPNAADHKRKKQ